MKIDRALLLHLERLSRLELAEDERAAMMDDLSRVLDYAEHALSAGGDATTSSFASPASITVS